MTERIAMETDKALVEVLPQLGGAIAAFDLKAKSGAIPILRRWTGEPGDPRTVASSPLVPWFNRISGGGITFDGTFYPMEPNQPWDAFPIHGDAWYSRWDVVEISPSRIEMRFRSNAIPPFDYETRQVLSLAGSSFDMELSVTNRGDKRLPFGLGQHPWFVRTPGVTLKARATGVWLEQPPAFPEKVEPEPLPAKWDFTAAKGLPDDFIDNGFAGWDGRARIEWADRGVAVDVEADPAIHLYHVYSLGKDHEVFCFEPVTHENNAYAKPGGPEVNDLRVLEPGESTSMFVRLTASEI